MSATAAGLLQLALVAAALVAVHRPLGDYMARVFSSERHLRVERATYRLAGVDPAADQRWPVYARSVLAFSLVSVIGVYVLQRVQHALPGSLDLPGVHPDQAWNTAVSFVTNTNWQSYSGESTMGYLVQMAALAVQNFASAAVGLAVAIALIRGFTRNRTDRVGNFWVDVVRGITRILLPLSFVFALVLVVGGAVQNFVTPDDITTLSGGTQSWVGGPVASQEAIKELGTNGGGFYNANSAHPFENPTAWTNLVEIFLLLAIPFSLPRTFGRLVGRPRQGYAIVAAMAVLFLAALSATVALEVAHPGTALQAAGASTEGKEVRFGVVPSAAFGVATTMTSTGAVNSFHSSYTALGGGVVMVDMLLGEISPGGVGSGLYGLLVLAILSVFIAGLMVGRTPEFLGKQVRAREIKLVSLYILVTPAVILVGTAIAMAFPGPRASMLNGGAHGLSEILYAFTSAANNNGSAFAGLSANTTFFNTALGIAMLLGRLVPIVLVLALAGSFSRQATTPTTAGTLPTHRPLFVGLLVGVALIVTALTYLPALALGPLAEGLH